MYPLSATELSFRDHGSPDASLVSISLLCVVVEWVVVGVQADFDPYDDLHRPTALHGAVESASMKACVVVKDDLSASVVCVVMALVGVHEGVFRSARRFFSVCGVRGGGVSWCGWASGD